MVAHHALFCLWGSTPRWLAHPSSALHFIPILNTVDWNPQTNPTVLSPSNKPHPSKFGSVQFCSRQRPMLGRGRPSHRRWCWHPVVDVLLQRHHAIVWMPWHQRQLQPSVFARQLNLTSTSHYWRWQDGEAVPTGLVICLFYNYIHIFYSYTS